MAEIKVKFVTINYTRDGEDRAISIDYQKQEINISRQDLPISSYELQMMKTLEGLS